MRGTTRHAFTLVDLLLSLLIVAVLMTILVPCLRGAREEGRRAVCLAHLHTLAGVCASDIASGPGVPVADWEVRTPGRPEPEWNLADQWEMPVERGGVWVCPSDPDWRDGGRLIGSAVYNWGPEIARSAPRARRMLIEEETFTNDKPVFCDVGQWHNGYTSRAWMDGRAVTKWE